jgi:hypothetical protein
MKRIKESHWIIHNDKRDKIPMVEDEFCQDYDNLHATQDSGLRIVETISIPEMPKDLSIKQKRNTKGKIPTALLNTNRNLCKTNEILLSIVKMIKISLKTNNVEEADKATKNNLESKLEQQEQEHLLFVQSITNILKANDEKERHMQSEINSLRIENERLKENMKTDQQRTMQKTDLSNQNYYKQTARKSTIYKDLRYTR